MRLPFTTLIAAALAIGLPAAAAASCSVETVTYQCAPETRTWISGHYEWLGDDYAYVPGYWAVTPVVCSETRVVSACAEPVVYTRPACERSVVYVQRQPAVVYTRPSYDAPRVVHTRPSHHHDHGARVQVSLPLPPVAVLPVPIPVPFFGRHR